MFFALITSSLAACAYGLWFTHQPVGRVRTAIKATSVGSLAAACVFLSGPLWLGVALALGTMGDVFLVQRGDRAFLAGLGAFLLGHLAYVWLLWGMGSGWAALAADPLRPGLTLFLTIGAAVILRRLLPHMGAMRLPVLAYATVILCMGGAALTLPLSTPLSLAILGAFMFIASDAILGFDLFVLKDGRRKRRAATVLWFLYWGGQTLIFWAVLQAGGV